MINRLLLKILWSIGGAGDAIDGLPRLRGSEFRASFSKLLPGDLLLLGNNGVASHVAVYVGEGRIVHSMATEKTMRGWRGSLWDALLRPWRWLWGQRDQTGVLEESLDGFVDRFERDTWIAVRAGFEHGERQAGIDHIRTLVGKAYDYHFEDGDDHYYCTEIAVEYLHAARPEQGRPSFDTRLVRVPGLLHSHVIEPVALLDGDGLVVVAANQAAAERYGNYLDGVELD